METNPVFSNNILIYDNVEVLLVQHHLLLIILKENVLGISCCYINEQLHT